MNAPHIARNLLRRRFLRGAGVTLALPLLECLVPVFARGTKPQTQRRMLLI